MTRCSRNRTLAPLFIAVQRLSSVRLVLFSPQGWNGKMRVVFLRLVHGTSNARSIPSPNPCAAVHRSYIGVAALINGAVLWDLKHLRGAATRIRNCKVITSVGNDKKRNTAKQTQTCMCYFLFFYFLSPSEITALSDCTRLRDTHPATGPRAHMAGNHRCNGAWNKDSCILLTQLGEFRYGWEVWLLFWSTETFVFQSTAGKQSAAQRTQINKNVDRSFSAP